MFLFYFFRNPQTPVNDQNIVIIAPSYGKIYKIMDQSSYYRVAIFLSPLDVHVQYAPISGLIIKQNYYRGNFSPAYLMEKSQHNERLEHIIKSDNIRIGIVQIAGQIARRIVSFKQTGQFVYTGTPIGMIKFGSRCDIIIPKKQFSLNCHVGQKLIGGQTIIAIPRKLE